MPMSGLLDKRDTRPVTPASIRMERVWHARPTVSRQLVRVDGLRFRRGDEIFRVQGVTYGPFAPAGDGTQFPSAKRVGDDFRQMSVAGVNTIRVYHPPPHW